MIFGVSVVQHVVIVCAKGQLCSCKSWGDIVIYVPNFICTREPYYYISRTWVGEEKQIILLFKVSTISEKPF